MHLFFLDGSGNTGNDLAHPTSTAYFLLALAVPGDRARALEDVATAVLQRAFGDACARPGFECKGSDLFRGEGPCRAMRAPERVALYGELLDVLPAHGVSLIWRGIDKRALAARYARPLHPHKVAFVYLVEEIERFLRARRSFGLVTSDEEKQVETQFVEDLTRYKDTGTEFGYRTLELTRVVDNVHWVKSHHSRLLQLADCCAYLCQRQHRDAASDSASARAVRELWRGLGPCVWNGRVWP